MSDRRVILIIENNIESARKLEHYFSGQKFKTILSGTGRKAVQMIKSGNTTVDLVLVDTDLDGNPDGLGTAKSILELKNLPVLFMSDHTKAGTVKRAREISPYGYILKHSSPEILYSAVETAFTLFRAHSKIENQEVDNINLAEQALMMRSVLDQYNESIWTISRDYKLTYINDYHKQAYKEAFDLDLETGMDVLETTRPEAYKLWEKNYQRAMSGEKTSFDFLETSRRGKKYFRVNLNPIFSGKKVNGVSAIAVDVTEQRTAELKSQQEMIKAKEYLDISPVLFTVISSKGQTLMVNRTVSEVTGYSEKQLLENSWFDVILPDRFKAEIKAFMAQLLKGEQDIPIYHENPILTKDGKELIIGWYNKGLKDENGRISCILSSGVDITEQRNAENELKTSERTLRILSDYTLDWEYWLKEHDNYVYLSPSVEKITGYSVEEFKNGSNLYMQIIHEDDKELFSSHHHALISNGDVSPVDFRIVTKSGEIKWISHSCRIIHDENGSNLGIRGSNKDITDRKLAEDKIKELLAQKELLLREVHHRVKNNMTTLISLLSLQINRTDSEIASDVLFETQSRIRSMMVLYDRLYKSASFESASIDLYMSDLVDSIIENSSRGTAISVIKNLKDFSLPTGTIFNIGIIVNEIITNAVKYAFKGKPSGSIEVKAYIKEENFVIKIRDNGIGFPDNFSLETNTGFGLKLVQLLVNQLDGTIRLRNRTGAEYTIKWPCSS